MFAAFWSIPQIEINLIILINILGALILGMMVGYERSYHGRAAGMRTYGLVCMASSALTVILAFPNYWFGGLTPLSTNTDPTRIIQGIVTGIGFLGAGVIMKEGLNISGLTTAASIWASSAIGILCGAGFYLAAILLTLISSAIMIWGGHLEKLLPSRHALAIILNFQPGYHAELQLIQEEFANLGFQISEGSMSIIQQSSSEEWHMVITANTNSQISVSSVALGLKKLTFLTAYQVAFARN